MDVDVHNLRIAGVALDDDDIHLLYTLLAGIPLPDQTDAQRQALLETANELEAKVRSTLLPSDHQEELDYGKELLEKRAKILDRKALNRELQAALIAIGRAGRHFIRKHVFGTNDQHEEKDDLAKESSRKRKREQFDALEEKFDHLDQLRTKLKLNMHDEDDPDDQRLSIEACYTREAKVDGVGVDAVPAMEVRVESYSPLAVHHSETMNPIFPHPTGNSESERASTPIPATENLCTERTELMNITLPFGSSTVAVTRNKEDRCSYGSEKGGVCRDIYGVGGQSEQIESDDDKLSRTISRGTDASSSDHTTPTSDYDKDIVCISG